MSVKTRVEKRLSALSHTKSWLAAELGVEKQNVNNWLSRNKIPEEYLFNTARLLQCDPEWLATGHKYKVSEQAAEYVTSDKIRQRIDAIENASPEIRAALDRILGLGD